MLLGNGVRGLLEQHQVVGTLQRAGMAEVHFELAVCIFMVELQHVEPAGRQRFMQRPQERRLARQALQVVAGFVEAVASVERQPLRALAAQQKELGLNTGLQRPAALGEPRHGTLQYLARAGVERGAIDEAVAHDACVAGHPGQGLQGAGVAARVVLGACAAAAQAGAGDARAGEARARSQHLGQVFERHPLALGHAVHIGELDQQRVNALGGEPLAQHVQGLVSHGRDRPR